MPSVLIVFKLLKIGNWWTLAPWVFSTALEAYAKGNPDPPYYLLLSWSFWVGWSGYEAHEFFVGFFSGLLKRRRTLNLSFSICWWHAIILQGQPLTSLLLAVLTPMFWSNIKVNLAKLELLSMGEIENVTILAEIFGCRISSFPITYLWLSLGAPFKAIWDEIMKKLASCLSWMEADILLNGRRSTLTRACFPTWPPILYLFSHFLWEFLTVWEVIMGFLKGGWEVPSCEIGQGVFTSQRSWVSGENLNSL